VREIAPLVAENDDDDSSILADRDESSTLASSAATAAAACSESAEKPGLLRNICPHWTKSQFFRSAGLCFYVISRPAGYKQDQQAA